MKKNKHMRKSSTALFAAVISLIIIVAVILVIQYVIKSTRARAAEQESIDKGISYLAALESREVTPIEDEINDSRTKERIDKTLKGDQSIWSMFKDYVILGDSRAVGFYYFDYLEKSRVLADGGATIADIEKKSEAIKALNPREIFLCYGLNDVSIGYWNSTDEYVKALDEELKKLQKLCPKATIYVSSILPAKDPAFELASSWREIPEYNVAISDYCSKNKVPYIDNSNICEEHSDMWDIDGIHVRKEFYPYWANNMISEVYKNEEK